MAFFIMDLSLRSVISIIKTSNYNLKKHISTMNCTLEPTMHSCDTGQQIHFLTAVN